LAFRRVQIFSTETGKKLITLVDDNDFGEANSGFRRTIEYIYWYSHGIYIVTGTDNGLIQIWDIRERRVKNHFELNKFVGALGVSLDGKLFAILSKDGIEIDDIEISTIVQRFRVSGTLIPAAISFSADPK
jgi:WD40 repeat protein